MVVAVNNDDSDYVMTLPAGNAAEYIGALSGERVSVTGGNIAVNIKANAGEIWLPVSGERRADQTPSGSVIPDTSDLIKAEAMPQSLAEPKACAKPEPKEDAAAKEEPAAEKKENAKEAPDESFEKGRIAGLQEAILAIMEKNGPVTEQMKRDVRNNVYHDSLITWIKSFR